MRGNLAVRTCIAGHVPPQATPIRRLGVGCDPSLVIIISRIFLNKLSFKAKYWKFFSADIMVTKKKTLISPKVRRISVTEHPTPTLTMPLER